MIGELTAQPELRKLTETVDATDADLRVELRRPTTGSGDRYQDPARVFACRLRRGPHSVGMGGLVGHDDQGEHAPCGAGPLPEPLRGDRIGDLRRRRVVESHRHGRLQTRPSRAIMSCELRGPQVPDS